uniref:Uncharacterized protein n=1 Tax=Nicotiana tabacum TaxID=4097 RepID=A0A1S3YPZ1_TOBAC|nr:PREDICTED: uncharacterized protein LOC107778383 [Nicotiana tabacum]
MSPTPSLKPVAAALPKTTSSSSCSSFCTAVAINSAGFSATCATLALITPTIHRLPVAFNATLASNCEPIETGHFTALSTCPSTAAAALFLVKIARTAAAKALSSISPCSKAEPLELPAKSRSTTVFFAAFKS